MLKIFPAVPGRIPEVTGFFHPPTATASYVVADPESRHAAIIDPVLDFDYPSARTGIESAAVLLGFIEEQGYAVDWILETHVHADHLTAAPWLKARVGGQVGIGAHVGEVQAIFARLFNLPDMATDGRQFDHLFADGETFSLGNIPARVIPTPGHTPTCISYLIGDAVFVGDTLFMPDYGTARCDFPGGDPARLYRSIHTLYTLPDETRMFLCHDYLPESGRKETRVETTVGAQRRDNVHVREDVSEDSFVTLRRIRDSGLTMPQLIVPSVQINMRAGHWPEPEENGIRYLKVPLDQLR